MMMLPCGKGDEIVLAQLLRCLPQDPVLLAAFAPLMASLTPSYITSQSFQQG